MATLKDVAREAGISVGTVSAILNGGQTAKEINRKKVFDAVNKLNYKPNLVARTLKTGSSNSIGLLLPDITNPFYPELARGIEDAARKEGFTVFLCNNDRSAEKESEYIKALTSKNVDGIVLVKPRITTDALKKLNSECRIVLIDPTSSGNYEGLDVVKVKDKLGVKKAIEYLIKCGHRKIAYISGSLESRSAIDRFTAYKETLAQHKIAYNEEYVKNAQYSWLSGYGAAFDLLKLMDQPTAIFASNDIIAFGVLKALRERNFNVPDDISVVGFDDIDQSSYCAPPLTTVRQPKYQMGVMAVNILIDRIRKNNMNEPILKEFEAELIVRDTVNYARTAIKV